MYLTGDFVTPRDDWVRYFEKPPLVYWTETAAVSIFGVNEFAIRLPAALFSAAQVGLTAALADLMFGEAVAVLAAVVLTLSPLFFGFSRFATLDPALAFFMTAALAAFYVSARSNDFGTGAGRRWFIVAAAMLALGTLTKGLVAPVLCGAIALIWIFIERRSREIKRMPWFSALALYLAITSPWFVLAARRNPGFLHFFFVHEHLQRYLLNTEHGWGPWFFIPVVIGGTWPWFFFVPFGLMADRDGDSPQSASRASAIRFLIIWFAVIFVFFSMPRAKLGSYVLPALPALAILAALGIARLWSFTANRARLVLAVFAGLNVIGAIAAPICVVALRGRLPPAVLLDALAIVALFAAIGIIPFLVDHQAARPGAAVIAIVLGMILVMGVADRARKDAASLTTYRTLAQQMSPHLRPGCIVGSYRHDVHSIPFYTGFREALISYRGELAPFGDGPDAAASFINSDDDMRKLWSSASCFVIVANRKDLKTLETLTPPPTLVGCEGKKVAIFNRSVAHPIEGCGADQP
jgi:4-amino-4-deoxy-L-arabinose transferase-like glycosyltransferase